MKLLTHNLLQCRSQGCDESRNFPFLIEVEEIRTCVVDFDPDRVLRMLPRLRLPALIATISNLQWEPLPPAVAQDDAKLEEHTLKLLHHYLFEKDIEKGSLVCSICGRRYPIASGIPQMLAPEKDS